LHILDLGHRRRKKKKKKPKKKNKKKGKEGNKNKKKKMNRQLRHNLYKKTTLPHSPTEAHAKRIKEDRALRRKHREDLINAKRFKVDEDQIEMKIDSMAKEDIEEKEEKEENIKEQQEQQGGEIKEWSENDLKRITSMLEVSF